MLISTFEFSCIITRMNEKSASWFYRTENAYHNFYHIMIDMISRWITNSLLNFANVIEDSSFGDLLQSDTNFR